MTKICHMTSAHPPEDVRIFSKECVSLAKAGYDVYLVEPGESCEKDGVHIVGVGQPSGGRLSRMTSFSKKVYRAALALDAELYHVHDPELLPYALRLKKRGKKVIFDSHEDVPADILEKYWISEPVRKFVSLFYARWEKHQLARLDGVISVTPHICDRLRKINPNTEMVTNYPIPEENLPAPKFQNRKIIFPGLVSRLWCLDTVIRAIEPIDGAVLELRSGDPEGDYLKTLKALPGWEKVNFPGKISHSEVMHLMTECSCGVALVQYCPNTGWKTGTLGNTKIFEYMMAGIPVVCTDFVLWKEIADGRHCGICVNPEDVEQVRQAIRFLLDNPEEARRMGENGRRAVQEQYNWKTQEENLLRFYKTIL